MDFAAIIFGFIIGFLAGVAATIFLQDYTTAHPMDDM